MTIPDEPRRRWLRFSLRTLFVLVTVIACWLGWQVHVVQHRKAILKQIEADGGFFPDSFKYSTGIMMFRSGDYDYQISKTRRSLGDRPVHSIVFRRRLTAADRHAIEAFPEAELTAIPEPAPQL
jgi:hypothetical protein